MPPCHHAIPHKPVFAKTWMSSTHSMALMAFTHGRSLEASLTAFSLIRMVLLIPVLHAQSMSFRTLILGPLLINSDRWVPILQASRHLGAHPTTLYAPCLRRIHICTERTKEAVTQRVGTEGTLWAVVTSMEGGACG